MTENASPEAPPSQTLTGKTLHSVKWSYTSTLATAVLQVAVTVVLARLLTPEAFGVVAMAVLVLRFGQYFAQLGVSQAIVQSPKLSAEDVRTAFTLSVLSSVLLFLAIWLCAPVVTLLFPGTPQAVPITRAMAVSVPFSALAGVSEGLLRRRFAFKWIAFSDIGAFLVGYAGVSIVLAVANLGPWSLVCGTIANTTLIFAGYYSGARHNLVPCLARDSLRRILSFGGRVSVISFLEFLGSTLDTFWTGHSLGVTALGLYTRATNLVTVPVAYLVVSFSRVLQPSFSRVQSETDRLRSAYLGVILVFATLTIPFGWGVAAASYEVILVLLGSQWTAAVPVLLVLAVAAPFSVLTAFAGVLCEATATLNPKMLINVVRVCVLVVLLAVLAREGIVGIAAAFAISQVTVHGMYFVLVGRLLRVRLVTHAGAYAVGSACGLAVAGTVRVVHVALGTLGCPLALTLIVQFGMALSIWLAIAVKARHGVVWREVRVRLGNAEVDLQRLRYMRTFVSWIDKRTG